MNPTAEWVYYDPKLQVIASGRRTNWYARWSTSDRFLQGRETVAAALRERVDRLLRTVESVEEFRLGLEEAQEACGLQLHPAETRALQELLGDLLRRGKRA